jgi:hypothetical protein
MVGYTFPMGDFPNSLPACLAHAVLGHERRLQQCRRRPQSTSTPERSRIAGSVRPDATSLALITGKGQAMSWVDPRSSFSIGVRLDELSPQRPNVIVISNIHRFRERAAIQNGVHHAVKGRSIRVS